MSSHSTLDLRRHSKKNWLDVAESPCEPPVSTRSTWLIRTLSALHSWSHPFFKKPAVLPAPDSDPGTMLLHATKARNLDEVSRALIAGAIGMPESVDPAQTPLFECARTGWIAGTALLLPQTGSPACTLSLLQVAQVAHRAGHRDLGRLIESRARALDQKNRSKHLLNKTPTPD